MIDNIDTDQIIPAEFLKQVYRDGYGKHLFNNWRYRSDGSPVEDFELNKPENEGAQLLITGNNFGCGSSREHAAWALADYGFRVIVSTSFADIFKNNAFQNGILPVELKKEEVHELESAVKSFPGCTVEVDLERQKIACEAINAAYDFQIDPFKKFCLMNETSEMDFLLGMREKIEAYEQNRKF
jgi:3-isopropylmalate/(R)-2-methylmalate dehydratase small subunit